ncbi:ralA-binding protein 1-like isoform X2 [Homarus americanus]|uniref:ralA-binding protein 1-like isoform X2 n=1 Tax=Homarus americanus TaxID=6706 RepID=UPI001C489BB2|nr:ralA-binding protein 1-like isoform X2 [Homarus americanus]
MFCGSDLSNKVQEEAYGDSGHERGGKKELLRSKKKDKKDKNKDKGYAALGEDSSPDEMDQSDTRSPLKPKKPKSFKFLHKREKDKEEKEREKERDREERRSDKARDDRKREKEEKREEKKKEKEEKKGDKRKEKEDKKGDKKKEKEKEKEERKREKEEKKKSKKDKKKKLEEIYEEELPVFGVLLNLAVDRCPSHDGVHLPVIVRECIDYIEEHGLHCEGIYRLSGVKSKVQHLRRQYNSGDPVRLTDQEPHVVASLLKQYLRELPEPVLTVDMMPHFEDVAMIPNPAERAEAMRQLIDRLPTANRLLVQYMFKHMGHIIARERDTKMNYQNVSIVLSPTMQISHRVLNVLFLNHPYLFGNVVIKRYVPPIRSTGGERTVDQLRSVAEIEDEMMKQESLLGYLHAQVARGNVSRKKEERLWEAQRIVTLLKRKLRSAQRREEEEKQRGRNGEGRKGELSVEFEKESTSEDSQKDTDMEREDISSKEAASDDSKHGSESENSSGHSRKTSRSENNVTVVSVSVESESSTGNENDKQGNDDSSKDGSHVTTTTVPLPPTQPPTTIPALPKPVSARTERNKMAQALHSDNREQSTEKCVPVPVVTDDSGSVEVVEEAESAFQEPKMNLRDEEQHGHITVIQVGGGSGVVEEHTHSGAPRLDHSQVLLNQRPEMKRLTVDKVPLRESRSLDDSRAKGDNEYLALLTQEAIVQAHHEELLSMNHDLMRKLQAERAEITRLREEIQEMQTLYGYRTYSYDSSESEGSESDGESDTEEEMQSQLSSVTKINASLQEENFALTRRIQEEREAVVHLRVQLQQAHWKCFPHHSPIAPVC